MVGWVEERLEACVEDGLSVVVRFASEAAAFFNLVGIKILSDFRYLVT